jgi:hypothetical protein
MIFPTQCPRPPPQPSYRSRPQARRSIGVSQRRRLRAIRRDESCEGRPQGRCGRQCRARQPKAEQGPWQTAEIVDLAEVCRLAAKPAVDRPRPGITRARNPGTKGYQDQQRQMRSEQRQPTMLLLDLSSITERTRQLNRHIVAKAESPVVPTAVLKWCHGKVRPLENCMRTSCFTSFASISIIVV